MIKNRILCFEKNGWEDYIYWQKNNKKILEKINSLILEIVRNPFTGSGKPEALKANFSGLWSRRINDEHRLVYAIHDDEIIIVQCRYHY
ncbi:MAG: Txe/YoeB family addiction module toxin [Rickettsiales bacterium]|nr:Txe/YoeB family addiction module toxin [Rickettsiales bacterium]